MVRSWIFFAIGVACVVLAVVLLTTTDAIMTGIGVLLIGISNIIRNGNDIIIERRNHEDRKAAGILD